MYIPCLLHALRPYRAYCDTSNIQQPSMKQNLLSAPRNDKNEKQNHHDFHHSAYAWLRRLGSNQRPNRYT